MRPYQQQAIEAIRSKYKAGVRRQLLVLPTGSGKTRVCSSLAGTLDPKLRYLWVVHRDELAQQAVAPFGAHASVSVEMGALKSDPNSKVVIAGVQTLAARDGARLSKFDPSRFGIIAIDEAHHSTAPSFTRIFEHFHVTQAQDIGSRLFLGVSATVNRPDGKSLGALFDEIVFERSLLDLMRDGLPGPSGLLPYLVDLKAHRVTTEVNISDVKTRGGDFVQGDLSHGVDTPERNYLVAQKYLELGENMPALCFSASVEHGKHLCQAFRDAGVQAQWLSGETPMSDRRAVVEQFRSGLLRVLISCELFGEGADFPRAAVALLARPTKSSLLHKQQVGRVCRPYPAPEDRLSMGDTAFDWIKPYAIVIDFVDNTGRHQIQTTSGLFGLPDAFDCQGKSAREVGELFERTAQQMPFSNIGRVLNPDQLRAVSEGVDLFAAPSVAPELQRWTRNLWVQIRTGCFCLNLKSRILEIRETALGTWELFGRKDGMREKIWVEHDLKAVLQAADSIVSQDEEILALSNARWRDRPPTEPQCYILYKRHPKLKSEFPQFDDFFMYASREFSNGNPAFSRGGVSAMLDKLAAGA